MSDESKKELEVRQHLEAVLEPGEELLAYTKGKILSVLSSNLVYIGLTPERLILLPVKYGKKPFDQALSIWREYIDALKWSGTWDRLKIQVPKGVMDLASAGGRWKRRAGELVDVAQQASVPVPDPALTAERQARQVEVFRELEMVASAKAIMERSQLPFDAESDAAAVLEEVEEKRIAFRVGAVFLFVNIGLVLLLNALVLVTLMTQGEGLTFPNLFSLIISVVVDLIIGINLWRGRGQQWASWAIVRAVLGMIAFGLMYLAQGAISGFLAQVAFCSSLILILTGKGKRVKTWVAIGIYVVYLGIVFISLMVAFLSPLFVGGMSMRSCY